MDDIAGYGNVLRADGVLAGPGRAGPRPPTSTIRTFITRTDCDADAPREGLQGSLRAPSPRDPSGTLTQRAFSAGDIWFKGKVGNARINKALDETLVVSQFFVWTWQRICPRQVSLSLESRFSLSKVTDDPGRKY